MKTKLFFLAFVLSLSINLFGQDFTFNNVDVNATECSFYNVYLSSNNEALLSGWETDAYYNGVAVNILSNSYNGDIFSVVETNDGMYALALRGGQYLYKWDNSNKVWGYTSIYPPVYNEISNILVVKPNLSVFISRYGDSLKMWKFNDTSFTLIKTIDNVDRYTDGFYFQPYIRENNVILVDQRSDVFFSYDYDTNIVEIGPSLYPIKTDLCTFDYNNYYFLTGEKKDSVIRFNAVTLEEEFVSLLPTYSFLDPASLFMISNNDIILITGSNGIMKHSISSSSTEILSSFNYNNSSYSPSLQKALLTRNNIVVEMVVTNKVHETEAFESVLKLYPIPASNKLTIDFPVLGINDKKIEIFNNLGQLVMVKVFSEFNSEIDVSDLKSGIYLVRLFDQETGKVLSSKKFVKQ